MLKSTSHRSIQHAKITKKHQYKNQIERKHTFRAFFLIKPILIFRRFMAARTLTCDYPCGRERRGEYATLTFPTACQS